MNIKRRAVILSVIISAFLTFSAAMNVYASDGTDKNTSPKDPSIKVLMPAKQSSGEKTEEETIKHSGSLSYGMEIIKKSKKLKKTSVKANIGFESADFEEFTDGGRVVTLTVRSLPDEKTGVLKLGALDVDRRQGFDVRLIQ